MKASSQSFSIVDSKKPSSVLVQTTLYDLIEAIVEEVPPEDDTLVTAVVLHLLDSGRIKGNGNLRFERI